jgi:hypothetical protein
VADEPRWDAELLNNRSGGQIQRRSSKPALAIQQLARPVTSKWTVEIKKAKGGQQVDTLTSVRRSSGAVGSSASVVSRRWPAAL